MVQIKWTRQAKLDMKNIFDYISNDSVKYAQRQIEGIIKNTSFIKNNTRIGRIVPELNNPQIREIIVNKYRVIYYLKDVTRVDLLTIHHSAKEFPDFLIE
ncbi:MAG: type II toxin-antitoxin system RelE/ParE family toxin [Ignavibacteriae bacterium HGW-Ignavibacteriae-4]|jgi:addiction module RelE/StbE family toxin|nr:MAG: type II toxin-antitoxin system RelE/ParE family toxin [Ignavibacteriae bacterium HGW-Ignavibacteriae-4]